MQSRVSEIMTRTVWSVLENDTLEKVEDLMNRHRLSSLPVVDDRGAIFGVISSVDLLRFREKHGNPKAARAWELCTFRPIEVGPSTPAIDAARMMVEQRVHHVVVTEDHKVVGFVSSLDFVERFLLNVPAR